MICFIAVALLGLSFVEAAILPERSADHIPAQHAGSWYQHDDHHVHKLFKRQSAPTDGVTYPTVGSAAWIKAYPPGKADTSKLPQEWVDALNAAVAAGKIPNLAPSTNNAAGLPTYGNLKPTSPQVCSSTYQCKIAGDTWSAPDGFLGCGVSILFANVLCSKMAPFCVMFSLRYNISTNVLSFLKFDDGPLPPSPKLYEFLQQNNQRATHFFIGTNILQNSKEFMQAFSNGDDIAFVLFN
jgi:hypothetical protein